MSETIRTDADGAIAAAEAVEAGVPAGSPADSPVAARAADDGRDVDFTNTNRWDTRQLDVYKRQPTSLSGLVRRLSELHISTRAKPLPQAGHSLTSPLSTFTSLPSRT